MIQSLTSQSYPKVSVCVCVVMCVIKRSSMLRGLLSSTQLLTKLCLSFLEIFERNDAWKKKQSFRFCIELYSAISGLRHQACVGNMFLIVHPLSESPLSDR